MTETDRIPADDLVRKEVIDPAHSFVVSAPAGSGKTGLLTHRVLNLLSVVEKPEEILAITFTRKAAAEMHMRIFSSLEKADRMRQNIEQDVQLSAYETVLLASATKALERSDLKQWDLLNNPGRLSVSTIDGFSKGICNQLPFFSGAGTQASVITNPQNEYNLITQRWLIDELKSENNVHLNCLIEHFSGNMEKLIEMFSALLGVRDQWLPLIGLNAPDKTLRGYFQSILQSWVADELEKVLPILSYYEGDFFQLFHYAEKNKEGAREASMLETLNAFKTFPSSESSSPEFWRAFAKFCLTKDKSGPKYRARIDKNLGFPSFKEKELAAECKEKKQKVLALFAEMSEAGLSAEQLSLLELLPDTDYGDASWQVLEAMISCLPRLVAYLKLRFSELGCGDFIEFSLSAVGALDHDMGDISLMQRLDYRIQHVLIDEFQDTSQTQLNLLRAITKDWVPGDGKSLFLVGDGMQSCYGFRNANVGIFLRMRQQGLSNVHLKSRNLTVNFRSQQPIVDWVNRTFNDAFPLEDDVNTGAVRYVPSESFKSSDSDSYIRCNGFQTDTDNEAQYIVDEIRALQAKAPGESIAILARSRPHLSEIIDLLKVNNIDYQAIDLDPLTSKQHVTDIDSLARYLFDPSDRLSYLALLRSHFCALTHADLYALFNTETGEAIPTPSQLTRACLESEQLSEDGARRLARFSNSLNQIMDVLGRRSFCECVETAWFRLGGPEGLENATQIRDIQTYLTLLSEHEQSGSLHEWNTFALALKNKFAASTPGTDNPVHIMTMHRSKGLEFDSVFLPSLEKRKRNEDEDVLYWLEKLDENLNRGFVLSPIDAKNSDSKNTITAYIKSQKAVKNELENTRIFYVACTRAKKRLYLSAKFKLNETDEFELADKSAFISKIWPHVEDHIVYYKANHSQECRSSTEDTPSQRLNSIRALPLLWTAIPGSPSASSSASATATNAFFDNDSFVFSEDWNNLRQPARTKGTVIHAVMQMIGKIGLEKFRALNKDKLNSFVRLNLVKEGIGSSILEELQREIVAQITHLRDDDTLAWIFATTHSMQRSEWSLWSLIDGEPVENIIDRSFIDGQTRWVLDYKTSVPEPGCTIDAFYASQLEQHRAQLLRYRKLVAEFESDRPNDAKPDCIKVGLYFPALPAFKHYESLDIQL